MKITIIMNDQRDFLFDCTLVHVKTNVREYSYMSGHVDACVTLEEATVLLHSMHNFVKSILVKEGVFMIKNGEGFLLG